MYIKGEVTLSRAKEEAKILWPDRWEAFWEGYYAYLPHSCDDWVIGGPEEIDLLISDLLVARAMLEKAE